MTPPLALTCRIKFAREGSGGRTTIEARPAAGKSIPPGRVPRIARLMALAIRLDGLIRSGQLKDQAAVARLGRVSRARVTQVMNLRFLAPDIQEQLLFLPPVTEGRAPVLLRHVQPIAREICWGKQREMWKALANGDQVPVDVVVCER
jgi:hypothetical protein